MPYSATDLRKDIYRILDQVLLTGRAVEVGRNGRLLRIVPVDTASPTERLRLLPGLIVGGAGAHRLVRRVKAVIYLDTNVPLWLA